MWKIGFWLGRSEGSWNLEMRGDLGLGWVVVAVEKRIGGRRCVSLDGAREVRFHDLNKF
jgi:hypothetical protein